MPSGRSDIVKDAVKFSSEYQPANRGRKTATRAWKDVLADMMPDEGYLSFRDVQELGEDGKPTGNAFRTGRVKMATQEMIVMAAIKQAMKGNMVAIDKIWSRMDGMPVQPLANDPDNPLIPSLTKEEIEYKLAEIRRKRGD
jgi:hypothetical protein